MGGNRVKGGKRELYNIYLIGVRGWKATLRALGCEEAWDVWEAWES